MSRFVSLSRRSDRWLVLQNNQELPKFPPLPFDFGSLCFLSLLIRLKFFLRLPFLIRSLISQSELAVRFAKLRIYFNRLLVIANGLLEITLREMQNSQLKISFVELGIDDHSFFE